jgi:hypothetical protein
MSLRDKIDPVRVMGIVFFLMFLFMMGLIIGQELCP